MQKGITIRKGSNWLNKSRTSLRIAKNISSNSFNNRVHCYYYSSLQNILHILHTNFNMSVEEIKNLGRSKNSSQTGGSHILLKNKVVNDLRLRKHKLDSIKLNKHLSALKQLRIKADYGYDNLNITGLNEAGDLNDKIQFILNKRYHERTN